MASASSSHIGFRPVHCRASGASPSNALSVRLQLPNSKFALVRKPDRLSIKPQHFSRIVVASASTPGASDREEERWLREESRWLRNEERWLREEQRWIREEKRWEREREQLLLQVEFLKEALAAALASSGQGSPVAAVDVEVHLRSLGIEHGTASSAVLPSSSSASIADSISAAPNDIPQPGVLEVPSPSAQATQTSTTLPPPPPPPSFEVKPAAAEQISAVTAVTSSASSTLRTLRVGSEGDEVEKMQNALGLEGFYCGEDDTEGGYFSAGTESAVKAWQACIGVKEDGMMTPKLLALLYGDEDSSAQAPLQPSTPETQPSPPPPASKSPEPTRDKPEIERYARSSLQQGEHRVFLLGEQRWEDPGRASREAAAAAAGGGSVSFGSTRAVNGVVNTEASNVKGMTLVAKQCFQCRGDGRVTCLECEGTGDLNIEEQFLDWVGEDASCVYCDGIGATTCDVCDGSGLARD